MTGCEKKKTSSHKLTCGHCGYYWFVQKVPKKPNCPWCKKKEKLKIRKYRNKPCRCKQDHMHRSRGEAGYCNTLALLVRTGEIHSYQVEKRYEIKVNGRFIGNHYPDFTIYNKDGKIIEVREFKSISRATMTDLWKWKSACFEALYPDIPYIVVKG